MGLAFWGKSRWSWGRGGALRVASFEMVSVPACGVRKREASEVG